MRITFNAMLMHVADDASTPKTFVLGDSVLLVAFVLEELETMIRKVDKGRLQQFLFNYRSGYVDKNLRTRKSGLKRPYH